MSENWAILKAAMVALLVAMLIWIWAEGESLSTRPTEEIAVSFPTEPSNDLVIRPVDPEWKGTVRIRLEGAVRALDRASVQLGREITLSAKLDAMPRTPIERTELDMATVIRSLPGLAANSSVVAEVTPAKVTVTVVKMVTRSLPVHVEMSRPLSLDGEPATTPATVDLRLPELLAATLPADAQAIATLGTAELAKVRGDGAQTVTAAVRPPEMVRGLSGVVIGPESVSVAFRIKQSLDSVKAPTVPVWYSLPPTEDGSRWNIEIQDKFLTDVTISGPSEEVQRIRAGQIGVKAIIEFSSDELERAVNEKSGITKQASFAGLPPGLNAVVANSTVRVKVTKRAAPNSVGPVDPGSGRPTP